MRNAARRPAKAKRAKRHSTRQPKEPLLARAERGESSALNTLSQQARDPDRRLGTDGSTLLHLAARHGHTTIVRTLLDDRRANPGVVRDDSITALYLAAQNNHPRIVRA